MKKLNFLGLILIFLVGWSQFAHPFVQAQPPGPERDSSFGGWEQPNAPTETRRIIHPREGSADILLIQTNDPWERSDHYVGANWYDGVTSDTMVLDALGYSYHVADWADIAGGAIDIFSYPVILIVNDQVQAFYDNYAAHRSEFEQYVAQGRTLVFFAAGYGWARGELQADLPGGMKWNLTGVVDLAERNVIVDSPHPIVTAQFSDQNGLLNADLYSNWCSHGWFSNLPTGTREILQESSAEGGRPTLVEYQLGRGTVIASTLTWEHSWSYHNGNDQFGRFARKALDDVFLYAFSKGVEQSADVGLDLRIEDAVSGSLVSKSQDSYVDVIVHLRNQNLSMAYDVQVLLTPQQDDFFDTHQVFVRLSQDDQNLQNGQVIHLEPGQSKEEVHRYHIKSDALTNNQDQRSITVKAKVQVGAWTGTEKRASFDIRRTMDAVIITNRRLLYQRWGQGNNGLANVSQLLTRLYETANGVGVVFYADLYGSDISNWDNSNTDQLYADESSANQVAQRVDELIQGWYGKLTKLHKLGPITIGKDAPKYLMIVGGDETIPFYRYKDPTGDEEDYTGSVPETQATSHNYILTDDMYADMNGNDWEKGELEVGVGRIVGSSAIAMGDLLTRAVAPDADTAVLASSAGWDLGSYTIDWGLEYDVPMLFGLGGFKVRNDDEEPRTIDRDDWSEAALREATNSEKVAFFFIGDHANHTTIGAPYDTDFFTVGDVGSEPKMQFAAIGEDHPLVFLSGCHSGLPATGDANALVQGLLDRGALAYIGNTGYSFGSGLWRIGSYSEVLAGYYANALVGNFGDETRPLGEAMRLAKKWMPSGLFLSAQEKKTYVETAFFGVPWRTLRRPGQHLQAGTLPVSGVMTPTYFSVAAPQQIAPAIYSLAVDVNIPNYTISQIDGFDVVTVADGSLDFSQGQPIVPMVDAYRLHLPPGASFVSVRVVNSQSTPIGLLNLPAADNQPVVFGGAQFVPTTVIDQLYPTNIVSTQVSSDAVDLRVAPIQHNTATKQTYHLSSIQIELVYESTIPVGIVDFTPTGTVFVPGAVVGGQTIINNVSDTSKDILVRLSIRNTAGQEVTNSGDRLVQVPPGNIVISPAQWQPDLPDGRYSLETELRQNNQVIGREEDEIEVRSGRVKSVEVLSEPQADRPGRFRVTFVNDSSRFMTVYETVYIYDDRGNEVTKLPQKTVEVAARGEEATEFAWDATSMSDGRYMVTTVAASGAIEFAPLSQSFAIGASRLIFASFLPTIDRSRSTPVPLWHAASGLHGRTIFHLTSTNPVCSTLFASTDSGAFRSYDGGKSWAPIFANVAGANTPALAFDDLLHPNASLAPAIAQCPTNPSIVYLTTWGGGIDRSTDAGNSWQPRNGGALNPYLYDLAIDPDRCDVVYAASAEAGVFKTTDGGGYWQAQNNGLGNMNTRSLALAPGNSNRLWVGTTGGVYRSQNGGAIWQSSAGLPSERVWAVTASPQNANTIYAGLDIVGVYKSTDGGASWQPQNNGLGQAKVRALTIDPFNPQVIYAGRDDGGGVYRSLDGGANWSAFNEGLGSRNIKSLWLDGGSCHTLLAGTTNGVWYFGP